MREKLRGPYVDGVARRPERGGALKSRPGVQKKLALSGRAVQAAPHHPTEAVHAYPPPNGRLVTPAAGVVPCRVHAGSSGGEVIPQCSVGSSPTTRVLVRER